MYEIKTYQNLNFGEIRTTTKENGVPLFCLKDICDILEIGNSRDVRNKLTDPYVDSIDVWVQTGVRRDGTPAMRNTKMTFVSEAGLYQAIFMSRKPNAQRFTLWVTNEVLPMIRSTGMYMKEDLYNQMINDPKMVADVLYQYAEEREKRIQAERQIEVLTPSAQRWDSWLSSKNLYNVHQASHILGIKGMGLKNLFKYFRENGFVSKENIALENTKTKDYFV